MINAMRHLLDPGDPLVIGHRGCAAVYPENTLPGFEHALSLGVDGLEFDVRVTSDGVPVVHHDPDTARTCGDSLVIANTPSASLRSLDAAATFSSERRTASPSLIPLLDEVLEQTRGTPLIIECKTAAAAPAVLRALRAHGDTSRAIVCSFVHAAVATVRDAGVASGASRREMVAMYVRAKLGILPKVPTFAAMCLPSAAYGLTLPISQLTAWGRTCGVPVHVWTVNSASHASQLWAMGVTGVLSDDPGTMLLARTAFRRQR
jgi:glycerophosphoryl diester phosphodiesterase